VPRAEAHARLLAAGFRPEGDYAPGHERWFNRNDYEVGLMPEHGGDYEEVMILAAEALRDERP
jgi:hypothetical protein